MSSVPTFTSEVPSEEKLVSVLEHHYGDGVVYIPENTPWSLYTFAKTFGYVSDDGYLTKKGRQLLSKFENLRT